MDSHLFSYFPENDMKAILAAFHAVTGLSVQLLDENGQPVISIGDKSAYCREFVKYLKPGESCQQEHSRAGQRAISLGDSYVFCCHSGLYHIVYPLISKSKMFGSVLAGPLLMDEADSDLILDLDKDYEIPTKSLLLLADYSHQLPVISPEQVTQISTLLYYLMNSLIEGSRELQNAHHEKLVQQSRINESIQMYKTSGFREDKPYPVDKENLLIAKIKSGNIGEARAVFNDLLAYLFLYEGHKMESIKIRIIELCTLLSRAAIEKGADTAMVLSMNDKLMEQILTSQDINDICYTFQDNMDIFTESLFYASDKSNRTIRKAAEYISANFAENISLAGLADEFHLNPSYLSLLFKQVTGQSFKEYLNMVRVEEAKRLLADTDYSIMDVAVACGFNDQSYFTKIFKKQTGLTPKQFR